MTKYYFSVYAQFKNEGGCMREWLDHYIWQGAEHFFMVDNGSTDNSKEIIETYGDKITYYSRPEIYSQLKNVREIVVELQKKKLSRWVLFCDLDEFLFSVSGGTITEYLRKNESYSCISINWLMFGSSGFVRQPPNIRQYFVMRQPDRSRFTKMIIQVQNVRSDHIHIHELTVPRKYRIKVENNELHLNHYRIQSEEFFKNVKLTRGDSFSVDCDDRGRRQMDYFRDHDKNQTCRDELLKNLVDSLQKNSNYELRNR